MSYSSSSSRYLEADILSRPPEWLVPLLFEHLVAALRRAEVQIELGDVAGKAASLSKATEILLELSSSLDRERGGELASRLTALYTYFAGEILTVGRTRNRVLLGRLIEMLDDLRDGWTQAAEQVAPRGRTASASLAASA